MKARGGSLAYGLAQAVDKYLTGPTDDAIWKWACQNPDKANRSQRRAIKAAAKKARKRKG